MEAARPDPPRLPIRRAIRSAGLDRALVVRAGGRVSRGAEADFPSDG
jgi:hypothetical protein